MTDPSTLSRARAWVEVRLDRLRENAAAARQALGERGRVVPMVKADAYGLGMIPVANVLRDLPAGGPWAFGVATVAEGESLRAAGWSGRILVFPPIPPQQYAAAVASDLTLCLSEVAAVRRLAELAVESGRTLPFHLEIDTGMGRAGFLWKNASEWGPEVMAAADGHLHWEGTFTHFHSSDEGDVALTEVQWHRFQEALSVLPPREPSHLLHVANSAAIFRHRGFGCDLARPGIYMYGGHAGDQGVPLPVVSVRARLALVRIVPAGSTVGYGATYQATGQERWGTLSIGYGDGVPRALAAGGGRVLVRGRRVPIIGRISMDMITVDLSDVPEAAAGDVCTLIGEDREEQIFLDEVAAQCGTISYEILTGLGSRLPRVYLHGEPDTL